MSTKVSVTERVDLVVRYMHDEKLPQVHNTRNWGVFLTEVNWLLTGLIDLKNNINFQNPPDQQVIQINITKITSALTEQFEKCNTQSSPIGPITNIYIHQIVKLVLDHCNIQLPKIDRLRDNTNIELNHEIVTLSNSIHEIANSPPDKFDCHLLLDKLDALHTLSINLNDFQYITHHIISEAINKLCDVVLSNLSQFTPENLITKRSMSLKFHKYVVGITHACFAAKNYFFIQKSIHEYAEWASPLIIEKLTKVLNSLYSIIQETMPFCSNKASQALNNMGDFSSQLVLSLHLLNASLPSHSEFIENIARPKMFHAALVRAMEKVFHLVIENTVSAVQISFFL